MFSCTPSLDHVLFHPCTLLQSMVLSRSMCPVPSFSCPVLFMSCPVPYCSCPVPPFFCPVPSRPVPVLCPAPLLSRPDRPQRLVIYLFMVVFLSGWRRWLGVGQQTEFTCRAAGAARLLKLRSETDGLCSAAYPTQGLVRPPS